MHLISIDDRLNKKKEYRNNMGFSADSSFKFSVQAILSSNNCSGGTKARSHNEHLISRQDKHLYKSPSPPDIVSAYSYMPSSRENNSPSHRYSAPSVSPPMLIQSSNKYHHPRYDVTLPQPKIEYKRFKNDNIQTPINAGIKKPTSTGRFRPPPFCQTVAALRQRLYELGGKTHGIDEPPADRNVHKLWRAVEKYKVDYSLQHYFYVASLSNRCYRAVENIDHKVSLGLLEGSRDKEVNQSYFNFLYGKTEEEQHRLLVMLETGELTPKDFMKVKKNAVLNKNRDQKTSSACYQCNNIIKNISNEKKELETKYAILKRKYDQMILEHTT